MYNYAILHDNNTCHTIIECNEERTDFADPYVLIDSYDQSYLNALWNGSEWEFPPTQEHRWNGTEWIDPNPIIVEEAEETE